MHNFTRLVRSAFLLPIALCAADKPNVILIFADDLGYGDVGCFYQDSPFKTPRLDRMACEGAMLTSFYVPTPYCAPSRGTILTGRYPFRHTVVRNTAPDVGVNNIGLPQSEITIAELLKEQGYATAAFGKWHLGHRPQWMPRKQGFDEYLGILYSNDMYPVQLVENEKVVEYPIPQSNLTQRYTDRTLEFIEENKDRPFFIYLPHAMPHKPLAASDNFYTPETRDNLYADTIAELDHCVGEILDRLKQLKLDEKTLVIFTSDNGPWYGGSSGGLRGMKGLTWEGGFCVPMIARMPGTIPSGVVNHHPAGTIDMLPTVCALAGIQPPGDRTIDGRNILPMLKHASAPSPHEAIFVMKGSKLAAVRVGKWKLHVASPGRNGMLGLKGDAAKNWIDPRGPDGVTIIAPFEQPKPDQLPGPDTGDASKAMMLFDLDNDRAEQTDLASKHPDQVKRLKAVFDRMAAQVPAFAPMKVDYQFANPKRGQKRILMRLIGGELRYDRIPKSQQHLIVK
ncbi:MAG: arylsulfatase [Verrucomicrobiales bacterium]|nr:arylsulfatase [Verrucomicrobiales bacterium]